MISIQLNLWSCTHADSSSNITHPHFFTRISLDQERPGERVVLLHSLCIPNSFPALFSLPLSPTLVTQGRVLTPHALIGALLDEKMRDHYVYPWKVIINYLEHKLFDWLHAHTLPGTLLSHLLLRKTTASMPSKFSISCAGNTHPFGPGYYIHPATSLPIRASHEGLWRR